MITGRYLGSYRAAEPFDSWRVFRLDYGLASGDLESTYVPYTWGTVEHIPDADDVMHQNTAVGFYSFKDRGRAYRHSRRYTYSVVAKLSNSGRVLEYTDGYRVSDAVITEVIVYESRFRWGNAERIAAMIQKRYPTVRVKIQKARMR